MLKQRGLSLIELMIAMVIGLVLMLGVTQVFLSTRQVYSNQEAISRIQETGRLAMEFIARDVRMAGFLGCASATVGSITNTVSSATASNPALELNKVEAGVEGFDGASAVPAGYGITRAANTDVLVVRAAMGSGVPISEASVSGQMRVQVTPETTINDGCGAGVDRISGICAGDIVVASDCAKSIAFEVNSISSTGVITHAPFSATVPLPETETFTTDGEVIGATTVVYYVGTSAGGRTGLFQKTGKNTPVELLDGVQDMQITYGVDTNDDRIPNAYRTAANIAAADWENVVSVRIQLLVESTEDNVSPEVQPYTFNSVLVSAPGDRRLRQIFVSTVGIRSRLR